MAQKKKNVLWFQFDEMRADSLGCMGSPWAKTPSIDRIASNGTAFTSCVCQAPVCLPSRSSQLAARYPWETGALDNSYNGEPFPDGMVTFPEIFSQNGYLTATYGKQHTLKRKIWDVEEVINCAANPGAGVFGLNGYDNDEYKVVQRPGEIPLVVAGVYPDDLPTGADICVDRAKNFLNARKQDEQPFFLRVSISWPHTPVYTPHPYDTLYQPEELPIPYETFRFDPDRSSADVKNRNGCKMDLLDKEELDWVWTSYMGLCAYVDHCVGQVMEHARSLKLDEDLIVMVSADHGKMLGEWGMGEKDSFEPASWRVPLIISGPGMEQNKVISGPCELIDTGKTLLEMAGLGDRIPADYRGQSLLHYESRPAYGADRGDKTCEIDDLFRAAVATEQYRVDFYYDIRRPISAERMDGTMFRTEDTLCKENLFYDPAYAAIRDGLLQIFEDKIRETGCDPRWQDPTYFNHVQTWEQVMKTPPPKHRKQYEK